MCKVAMDIVCLLISHKRRVVVESASLSLTQKRV